MIKAIVAIDENGAIGRKGDLLCHLGSDLRRFKELTTGGTIIMGRKTWDSFPRRPLPNRRNIVVTRDTTWHEEGAEVAHSLEEAIAMAGDCWVLGGGSIYAQAIRYVDELHVTRIHMRAEDADTFFPSLDGWERVEAEEHEADEKNEYAYSFERWVRSKV